MKAFHSLLHGFAIGDTLSVVSHDLHMQESGIENHFYVVFTGGAVDEHMQKGWFNWPLYSLYARAGLFQNLIVLDGLDCTDWNTRCPLYAPVFTAYIERNFGKTFTEIEQGQPFITEWKAIPCAEELRRRFQFLRFTTEPYATLHFTSSHNLHWDGGKLPYTKRASIVAVIRELAACPCRTVRMLGSVRDKPTVQAALRALSALYPNLCFEDCTGTSVEELFGLLYNSQHHIACETGTAFFTAQLGIPSTSIFLSDETHRYFNSHGTSRAVFEPFFSNIPALKCVTDSEQVCGTGNQDLVAAVGFAPTTFAL